MSDTQKIWDYLISAGMTPAGAAGMMGNMQHESGCIPNRVEELCLKRLKEAGFTYTHKSYTAAVNSGKIGREEFVHPLPGKQYGYGLCQWTSPGRKGALYDLAKKKGLSIGNIEMQLEFLVKELKESFPSVWKTLTSTQGIKVASDKVLKSFEMPANTGAAVQTERYNSAMKFFNEFNSKWDITAEDVLNVMRGWIGMSRSAGTHKPIIDLYNSHKPLARGYSVQYSDAYCDTTVSAAFIKLNATEMIGGTECGVEEHVKLFEKAGIWNEDGTIKPKPGYIIVFNWDDGSQPNDGYADHIGIVESVSGDKVTTIEGNMNGGMVGRRIIPIGYGYIRGYAIPKYAGAKPVTKVTELKVEQKKLADAYSFDERVAGSYIVTATQLNLRYKPGDFSSDNVIKLLPRGTIVQNYGYFSMIGCDAWYLVQAGSDIGYVSSEYLKKS